MPSPVNTFNRVQQWATFGRQWWLFDAYGQDPFLTGMYLRPYLMGKHKPIYSAGVDCGDHIVVMNSKFIAMPGDMWERIEYFHHTRYAGGASWTPAWKMHQEDPTEIFRRTVKRKIKTNKLKEVPEAMMKNISGQIRQLNPIPQKLADYTEAERDTFPRIYQFPTDFVLEPNTWYQPKHRRLQEVQQPAEASAVKS